MISSHHTLIVFDLDDTLTPFLQAVPATVISFLKYLEVNQNLQLALNSMQTCEFLSGLHRQAGLSAKKWFLIGENGAQIWFESQMPCAKYLDPILADNVSLQQQRLYYINQTNQLLKDLAHYYDTPYGTVGFVPNSKKVKVETLATIVKTAELQLSEPFFFAHHDFCLELGIKGVTKLKALKYIKERFNYEKVIVFGDSVMHDLPMLQVADLGIWFGLAEEVNQQDSEIYVFDNILAFIHQLDKHL